MGIEVGLALLSFGVGIAQQEQARKAASKSAEAERQARSEQRAQQAAQAAQERRQQIREERVRRARVLASSEATGGEGSSAEAGAIGSLATQLSSNIGFNLGQQASAGRQSAFLQQAADFSFQANRALARASQAKQLGSIFSGTNFGGGGGSAFSVDYSQIGSTPQAGT